MDGDVTRASSDDAWAVFSGAPFTDGCEQHAGGTDRDRETERERACIIYAVYVVHVVVTTVVGPVGQSAQTRFPA